MDANKVNLKKLADASLTPAQLCIEIERRLSTVK
jgi:hypothetical protein